MDWSLGTAAAYNAWTSVTYGNGLFVAVAQSGSGNRVMTSPDGITWTSQTSASDNSWTSVTYGNGLFVAVANSGSGNRVMTSPDGITWTSQISATDNSWASVTYGNGLFVAVANFGTGNRVMTSPDGITWTLRIAATNSISWQSVIYGNGLFVAVAGSGTGNRVMTSPDGINWTSRIAATNSVSWRSVTYGNGLFVAVGQSTTRNRVMTSPDGITWTSQTSASDNSWTSVTYGNELFVAVASFGTGDRVMTSPDGITWTSQISANSSNWSSVTYGNGLFVAVASSGNNRVMTSSGESVNVPQPKPLINSINALSGTAVVNFTQGLTVGAEPITNYKYSANEVGGYSGDNGVGGYSGYSEYIGPATSPLIIRGLTNGTTYNVSIIAFNGLDSVPSDPVSVYVRPTLSELMGIDASKDSYLSYQYDLQDLIDSELYTLQKLVAIEFTLPELKPYFSKDTVLQSRQFPYSDLIQNQIIPDGIVYTDIVFFVNGNPTLINTYSLSTEQKEEIQLIIMDHHAAHWHRILTRVAIPPRGYIGVPPV